MIGRDTPRHHCPICKSYLEKLNSLLGQASNLGVSVFTISGDTQERAANSRAEWNIDAEMSDFFAIFNAAGINIANAPMSFTIAERNVTDPTSNVSCQ